MKDDGVPFEEKFAGLASLLEDQIASGDQLEDRTRSVIKGEQK